MKTRKLLAVILALALTVALASCAANPSDGESTTPPDASTDEQTPEEKTKINIAVLKGPTGIGAAYLMEQSEKGETANDYSFTLTAAATDVAGQVASGAIDIAAVPTNLAPSLYAKTNQNVQMLAINTLGVLYVLENGDTVHCFADLRGKTIYTLGQGSNPEYVLNYLLRQNGLEPGVDVTVEFRDSEEISTLMASGSMDICMLPVPATTSILMKNADTRVALDVTDEWDKAADNGSKLTMGCLVIRKEFAEQNSEAVQKFIEEYRASIDYVNANVSEAAALVEKFEITGSAAIAEKAIPDCNLVCISGSDMKPAIDGYFQVMFDSDPTSVGGKMPDDGLYY